MLYNKHYDIIQERLIIVKFNVEDYREIIETMRNDKKTVSEISKVLGKSEGRVRDYIRLLGLSVPTNKNISCSDVKQLWDLGLTANEIAKHFNVSHDTITKRLIKLGIKLNRAESIKRHFKRTHALLWKDVEKDLNLGMSQTELSKKYKLRIQNVRRLMEVNNYTRKYISGFDDVYKILNQYQDNELMQKRLELFMKYSNEYGFRPNVRQYAIYTNISYSTIISFIKYHNIQHIFSKRKDSQTVYVFENKLKKLGVYYEKNNRSILSGKEIDFYIPDLKLGFELNPTTCHSIDFSMENGRFGVISKQYHQIKSIECRDKNISLFHIYDYDMVGVNSNADKILLSIKTLINNLRIKCGARKCTIRNINRTISNQFLQSYHFQGAEYSSTHKFGLYCEDILVSVLTIGKSRFDKNDFEIIRYCVNPYYNIIGGFSKLFTHFIKDLPMGTKITTFYDLNKYFMRNNNIYEQFGFYFVNITQPNYKWVNPNTMEFYSRQQTMKHILVKQGYPKEKTEKEIMRSRYFFRVFDAGSLKYEYIV